MDYRNIVSAQFLRRPNRFVAQVLLDNGDEESVHVKNTGRCAELLIPGTRVYLEESCNPTRKTRFDLIAVEKATSQGTVLVNMDSAAPNAAVAEWLHAGGLGPLDELRAEYTLGQSRFDFYGVQQGCPVLVEVKGCTLEDNGFARFPDAPTQRGIKHLQGLAHWAREGWRCTALFVIQMKGVHTFMPNWSTHPAFGLTLCDAKSAGVEILAMDCHVTPSSMVLDQPIEIDLSVPNTAF